MGGSGKGQGSMEYLLLIAGAVVVGMIVIIGYLAITGSVGNEANSLWGKLWGGISGGGGPATVTCGNNICEAGEFCPVDNCCGGNQYSPATQQTCCSDGTFFDSSATGTYCCADSDCAAGLLCNTGTTPHTCESAPVRLCTNTPGQECCTNGCEAGHARAGYQCGTAGQCCEQGYCADMTDNFSIDWSSACLESPPAAALTLLRNLKIRNDGTEDAEIAKTYVDWQNCTLTGDLHRILIEGDRASCMGATWVGSQCYYYNDNTDHEIDTHYLLYSNIVRTSQIAWRPKGGDNQCDIEITFTFIDGSSHTDSHNVGPC